MKNILFFIFAVFALIPNARADYYRATGGGVYELYVDDCSISGMRRSLDNAVATRRAVITSVKCAASDNANKPIVPEFYMDEIPAQYLCPCELVAL